MIDPNYQVVFDVTNKTPNLLTPVLLLILALIAASALTSLLVRYALRNSQGYFDTSSKVTIVVLWMAAVIVPCLYVTQELLEYNTAQDLLHNQSHVIEGRVENFKPQITPGRNLHEEFMVDGVRFSYSTYTPLGFTQTVVSGGPIRTGLQVRIHYLPKQPKGSDENPILRLETGQ